MLLNLKSAIAARGFSQIDFALENKIPPTVLSEIIHQRRRADAPMRARIAQALIANEEWLFSSVIRIPGPVRSNVGDALTPAMACSEG